MTEVFQAKLNTIAVHSIEDLLRAVHTDDEVEIYRTADRVRLVAAALNELKAV